MFSVCTCSTIWWLEIAFMSRLWLVGLGLELGLGLVFVLGLVFNKTSFYDIQNTVAFRALFSEIVICITGKSPCAR